MIYIYIHHVWYPVILLIPGTLKFTGQLFGSPIQTKLAFILRSVVRSWIFAGGFFPREVGEPHDVDMTQLYYAIYTGTTNCLRLKKHLKGIDREIETRFS